MSAIEIDLYWDDLTPEKQKQVIEFGVNLEDMNAEVLPIGMLVLPTNMCPECGGTGESPRGYGDSSKCGMCDGKGKRK